MSIETNKAVVRTMIEQVLNAGKLDLVPELIASNYMSHEAEGDREAGVEGFLEGVSMYRTAFPDAQLTVREYVAEGDKVVTWATFSGTHRGDLAGVPPTGKPVEVRDVDMFRVQDGKIIESWAHFDWLGMMQQLGVLPAMQEEM